MFPHNNFQVVHNWQEYYKRYVSSFSVYDTRKHLMSTCPIYHPNWNAIVLFVSSTNLVGRYVESI